MRVYTARVPSPLERTEPLSPDSGQGRIRRRRLPGQAEQARRKEWGRTWGNVGADYKKQRLAKEA